MDNSGQSDSACSDDTEYLLGQNVSIREIDDVDIPSHDEVPSSLGRSHRTSPHHSPQRLHHAKSTKSRSPQRKEVHARGKPMPQQSPEKLVERGGSKRSPVVEKRRDVSKAHRVMPQDGYGNERSQYHQNVENITRSKKSGRESKAEHFPEQRSVDSRRSPQFKPTGTSKTKSVSHKDSSHGMMSSRHTPPTRNDIVVDRQQKKQPKRPMRHVAPVNQENWEIESELSEDMVNGGYGVMHIETSELESEMSEATEDLIGGEDQENDDITEKLKELNLAVNYDTSTNEYFDDKVREGAELLSKLFGGNVDNYYSSSRVELTMATNTTNQNRWKRQPLRILRLSGQSKSSASGSGSVQEVSRSNGRIEERRNLSDSSNSTTHQSLTRSVTPQPRARVAEQTNTTVTDQSSSFESSVSTSGKRQGSATRKEVRFRDDVTTSRDDVRASRDDVTTSRNDVTTSRDRQWRDHQQLATDAPGSNHPFDGSYALSPHKDRGEQRFHVEKVSDNSHSVRRLDRQEEGAITGGFMTSTPHTKAQAVFSPPQSYQTDSPKEVQRMAQKLQETERKLNRSSQELKDVEIDIEDAMSRKKFAVQEIHVLEETVKRNKAEVQSSENLVEQYRQQATKTRSQLMELELQRDNLQHEIKELRSSLTRQKQESRHAMDVEKTNGLKVLELSIEKDQLHSEVESLQAQLQQAEGSLTQEKHSYLEKIGLLQDQLHEEQRVSKESVEKVKQQLEDERQKARDSHYERINAIHKLQDDSKEMHEKELEVLKNRLVREKEMELESLREKTKRECEVLNRKLQERDQKIIQLESNIKEHEEDITKLKAQVFQEQQKLFECESEWKENMARQDTHTKGFQLEVDSLKQKETSLLDKQRRTEELLEEKMLELRRHGEKASSYSDELNQIIKNKDEEITMLRGLVRQQEDATRLLGEKMRNEAQEHIRNALEKERESTDLERARHQAKLEEIRDKYESALKQVREELEAERLGHNHLNTSVNKIKKEVEKLRELNLQTEQERVNAVAQVRNEAKEEVGKMKDKIRELSSLAERSEKETVMEITEECRKTAALLGDSANTTPVRNLSGSYLSDSPRSAMDSPAKDALLNLRSYNEELRQHLTEARKELELNNRELALKKQQVNNGDLTIQQVSLFKKALKAKEDEVERFKRQLQEENERLKLERTTYQKTIDRLEKELKQAKAATPNSSPMVNGNSPPESGVGTSLSSATPSPRPGEDSSSARLLRHLQGRVQQLRAQNDSLRKSSENESLNESHCSVISTESVNGADDDTKRLHSALKMTEDKAQRNAAMLSQKMMEMTKLQKMLTHATKENMKLERAYASLQRKIIDSSR